MKSYITLTVILVVLIYFGCTKTKTDGYEKLKDTIGIINCNDDYDCLYDEIVKGNSARVLITEEIESLGLIEKSEVIVEPIDNQYKVTLTVLDLQEIEETEGRRSVIEGLSRECPEILNNLDKIISKSAVCYATTPETAKDLAINGLSEKKIKDCNCSGELIDVINEICVKSDSLHFPPGVRKPAIYLYPVKKSRIDVSIDINGFITESEPFYNSGWSVVVEPNGLIENKYDYLFYEAQLKSIELPEEGWVVKYSELEKWFDNTLPKLGLNKKEIEQFKDYWLKELKKANYYEIKLLGSEFLKENMNLVIHPKPETLIRLNFYFTSLNEKTNLREPEIITPRRKGFTVVEWGGLVDYNSILTSLIRH
jgi:hypothetical protein